MKVLLVITHGNMGGATNVVIDLAKGLKSKGVDVAVGFSEGAYLEKKLTEASVPRFNLKNIRRSHNPFLALFFIFEIKTLVEKERFDIVQFNSSNSLPGCLGAKLAKKKARTVFTVHGLSVLDKNCKTFFLLKFAYYLTFKFFLSFADATVFVSKNNKEEAEHMKLMKNGHVVYNGMSVSELAFLPRDEARRDIGEKVGLNMEGKFLIGSIGRPSYQKNYEFLIGAFPKVARTDDRAVCVIIGDGPKRAAYERLIDRLGLKEKVFLAGEVRDGSKYLKAFDLFTLPSRYEGLPVTLAECLYAGVPVLASDVGGNSEIASERSLYKLDDETDFIKKLSDAMKNPAQYVCPETKKGLFTREKMSEGYLELFKSLAR
jgi:glycosyltransferase involved in cell wall biosynthesis